MVTNLLTYVSSGAYYQDGGLFNCAVNINGKRRTMASKCFVITRFFSHEGGENLYFADNA